MRLDANTGARPALGITNRTEVENAHAKAVMVNGAVSSVLVHGIVRVKRQDGFESSNRSLEFKRLAELEDFISDCQEIAAFLREKTYS